MLTISSTSSSNLTPHQPPPSPTSPAPVAKATNSAANTPTDAATKAVERFHHSHETIPHPTSPGVVAPTNNSVINTSNATSTVAADRFYRNNNISLATMAPANNSAMDTPTAAATEAADQFLRNHDNSHHPTSPAAVALSNHFSMDTPSAVATKAAESFHRTEQTSPYYTSPATESTNNSLDEVEKNANTEKGEGCHRRSNVPTFESAMEEIERARRESCEEWKSGKIEINVATSMSNNTPKTVDLTSSIGHKKRRPKRPDDTNSWFLPSYINQNNEGSRVKDIYPMLVSACAKVGFKVHCEYHRRLRSILVECCRAKFHNEERNKKHNAILTQNRVRKTTAKKGKGIGPHQKRIQRPVKLVASDDSEDNDL